jgi:hypothetical protein
MVPGTFVLSQNEKKYTIIGDYSNKMLNFAASFKINML